MCLLLFFKLAPNLVALLVIVIFFLTVSSSAKKKGPEVNITKHISFRDFTPTDGPTTDITLLGSAAISDDDRACIHIPAEKGKSSSSLIKYSSAAAAAGRAIYSSPVRLYDPDTRSPASFHTTFSFQFHNLSISSSGISNSSSSSSGGLSFIIVPDELTVGRSGPWLAMMNDACEDEYKAVAVEFDSRMNAEFGDPNDNHVGVNLGSIVSSVVVNVSDFGIRLNDGSIRRAWITYDGDRKWLEIYLGPEEEGTSATTQPPTKRQSVYSGSLDLSSYLNEYMFVGFSGSTGSLNAQIHSICSWNFTSLSRAFLRLPSEKSCKEKIIVDDGGRVPSRAPSSFFIFLAVVVLVIIAMVNLYFNGKRRDRSSSNDGDEAFVAAKEAHFQGPPNKARKFSLAEVSSATRGFGDLQMLGSDGKSVTYKGTFSNGCDVAVKRFSSQTLLASDRRRMSREIEAIGKIRHPNLVPVRGWCFDRQETIVVYDFVPNGSLDKWMFGFGVLPWLRRFKIIKDVAEALSHLHSRDLAHKNVKASSVFLDVSFRALVGDFGFVLSSAESSQFESLVGKKVDVFEFGILVLEVVSGRVRKSGPGELDLLDLAWAMHEGSEIEKLVDRRMGHVVNPEQAVRVLEVGLLCTLNDNKGRPDMDRVAEFLNMERRVPELPRSRPVSLFPYSSTTGLCTGYSCASFKIRSN